MGELFTAKLKCARSPLGIRLFTLEGRVSQMFERFTDRARRVVVLAQEEARMLNHNYIGTEHILLGLIHEGEGVAEIGRASCRERV